jgi:hypothetical protein
MTRDALERGYAEIIAIFNEVPAQWSADDDTDEFIKSAFVTAQYTMTQPHVYTAQIKIDTLDDDICEDSACAMLEELKGLFNRDFIQQSSHELTLTYDMTVNELKDFIEQHTFGSDFMNDVDHIVMTNMIFEFMEK